MANIIAKLIRLYRHEDGSVLVFWAILLPVIAGMIGIGLETGTWYLGKRNLQAAADAGAIAGAYESTNGARITSATNEVARNGFSSGVGIYINNPPLTGGYTSNNNAVEVILSQPKNKMFSSLFLNNTPTLTARAVASRQSAGDACVLALSPSASSAVGTTGSASVIMDGCTAAANSTSSQAITVGGSSLFDMQSLYTPGGYSVSGSGTLTTDTTPITGGTPLPNPYQNLAIPSYSGCDKTNYGTHNTVTLSPGVYCGGISLGSHADVTLQPGVYIINKGTLDIGSQSKLTGTGVTIILTSSTGSNYATVNSNGGAIVNISAPTTGPFAGVAFFHDPNTPTGTDSNFNGGATMNITGSIYAPTVDITFSGGSQSVATCTEIISWTVTFTGNNNITNDCPGSGMPSIDLASLVKLQE